MTNPCAASTPCCKVGAVAEAYGLVDLDAVLHERWTAQTGRSSVRELADYVNRRVLRSVLSEEHEGTLAGEVENYYRLLTDEDVSGGMRAETRNRLRDRNVDVETVEDDFLSHQTVYRHLTGCLDATRNDPPTDSETAVRAGLGTIRALQRRTEAVASSTLDRLGRAGHFDVGEIDVLVDVVVTCRGCGDQLPLSESLAGRSCRCGG